jgi:hypothetical protein
VQCSADLGYGEQGRYFCIWFPPALHSGDTTFTPFGIATAPPLAVQLFTGEFELFTQK